jgi:hypothetical protein
MEVKTFEQEQTQNKQVKEVQNIQQKANDQKVFADNQKMFSDYEKTRIDAETRKLAEENKKKELDLKAQALASSE